jgi:2-polyprenyl-3-methyl-5-hydroxy-6-metoxy-1,4-benzoquinol methylase
MATTPAPRITPERIFNTLTAYQQTAALRTAIEMDIFTAIGEGADQPATTAKRIGASERGVRILCDYLTIHGFLEKKNGRYALTPESARFLDRRSPTWIGSMASFLSDEQRYKAFALLSEAVRKGGAAHHDGDNTQPHDDRWVQFAKSMAPMTAPYAAFIAKLIGAGEARPMKVLDIAAGHGMYGITIAKQDPNAQIVAVDWPAVLEVAKENAQKAGVAARYATRPGSAFETDLGTDHDYALLTNIAHHFDPPACEKLFRRVHAALKPGGKIVLLEFVPNEDRISPPTAASFALIVLANTDAGDAYTFAEYEKMLRNAGFSKASFHPVPELPEQVILAEK